MDMIDHMATDGYKDAWRHCRRRRRLRRGTRVSDMKSLRRGKRLGEEEETCL